MGYITIKSKKKQRFTAAPIIKGVMRRKSWLLRMSLTYHI